MKRFFMLISVLFLCGIAFAQEELPFKRIDTYMFVDGEVNGIKGRFMIDTGTSTMFLINNHFVPVEHKDTLYEGTTDSGQKFLTYKSDDYSLKFNFHKFSNLKDTYNADFGFIEEGIYPQFLGFIGYGYLCQYKFAIDYKASMITLYTIGKENTVDTRKHPLLTTIHFTVDDETPQMPLAQGTIAGEPFSVTFDTGGDTGSLKMTKEIKERLISKGALKDKKNDEWDVSMFCINGIDVPTMKELDITEDESNQIGLSYEFLKHYITVWDYSTKTIELYKK